MTAADLARVDVPLEELTLQTLLAAPPKGHTPELQPAAWYEAVFDAMACAHPENCTCTEPTGGHIMSARTNTPDRVNADGSRTITTKRYCNGCDQQLGDITDAEMAAAIDGRPLPDVRRECSTCGPTAPEPACYPMQIIAGEPYCIEGDCDHERDDYANYCEEVREETVCATHSQMTNGEEITHAEPWPCQHSKAVAA